MKILSEKYCKYCDPCKVNSAHFIDRLENTSFFYALQSFFNLIESSFRKKFPRFHYHLKKIILENFFNLMIIGHILQEVEVHDSDESLCNRSLVVIKAARLKGIKIKALKTFGKFGTNFFTTIIKHKKTIFEGFPPLELGHTLSIDFDDKLILKQVLENNGMPFAEGKAFVDIRTALNYAKKLSFPLVVKPRSGSLSKHTVCDIQSENELRETIKIAQIISREFILEKFITGDVYRITIVDNKVIACCLREPPNVVGDGVHTIEELINIKNNNPLRGDKNKKNFTLHKIIINRQTILLLERSKLALKSVLSAGKKVHLHNKIVLACGADIHDKTDDVHPDNNLLFVKLTQLLKAPIIGIDFICQDISKPYHEQMSAIIEANSLPYIDMHHFPVSGKARDVAGYIVDRFLL